LDNENEKIQNKISRVYDLYVSTNPSDEAIAPEFKKQYCCPVHIEFMGVWWVSNLLQLNPDQADMID